MTVDIFGYILVHFSCLSLPFFRNSAPFLLWTLQFPQTSICFYICFHFPCSCIANSNHDVLSSFWCDDPLFQSSFSFYMLRDHIFFFFWNSLLSDDLEQSDLLDHQLSSWTHPVNKTAQHNRLFWTVLKIHFITFWTASSSRTLVGLSTSSPSITIGQLPSAKTTRIIFKDTC